MKYQREIDGLRALAVVPVVLHHAHAPGFGGGFLGVDVFFVISGFLIIGIVQGRIDGGRFSIVDFYERRLKRLMPALFTVLAFVLAVSLWLQSPGGVINTAKSLVSVPLYASNVYFWQSVGYFEESAVRLPLLHTWSLAVEEQFYVFLPPLLWGIHRVAPSWTRSILAVIGLFSFALAVGKPGSSSFFLLPSRAWELVLGGVLALSPEFRASVREREGLSNVLALLGFVGVMGSMSLQSTVTQTPGPLTLVPVVGTALILLAASPTTWVGRLLCTRPMVGIGLISYSWYLWHQPLFAFYRIGSVTPPSWIEMTVLGVVSAGAGALSWRFVEQPFRAPGIRRSRVFLGSLTASVVTVLVGILVVQVGGLPGRFDAATLAIFGTQRPVRVPACVWRAGKSVDKLCRFGNGPKTVLVVGDSYAAQYVTALGNQEGLTVVQLTKNACAPAASLESLANGVDRCDGFGEAIVAAAETLQPDVVLVAANWHAAVEWIPNPGPCSVGQHIGAHADTLAERLTADLNTLSSTGVRTVLLGEPPQPMCHVPSTQALRHNRGLPPLELSRSHVAEHNTLTRFQEGLSPSIEVLDPTELFCPGSTCALSLDGELLYFDDGHLSRGGAQRVVEWLVPQL